MTSSRRPPNELFRAARLRLKSADGDSPMSREELADLVNSIIDPRDTDGPVAASDIGKLERGIVAWPRKYRRQAYRKVLNAATDAEIGLTNRRIRPTDRTAGLGAIAADASSDGYLHLEAVQRTTDDAPHERPGRIPLPEPSLGIAAPALTLDDLDRIDAVARNARRYLDETLVGFLDKQLAECAVDDGVRGPRYALPGALGIVSIVQRNARVVKWNVRRPLLRVGARAAEFTGWLYRDAGHPEAADYWRDRASEWAMEATDYAMPGYILIKKSQSAWDARDATRMLGLAEAVQEGPWALPARVMAEAVQQQARGMAMLESSRAQVDDTLKRARELLEKDSAAKTPLAAHYDKVLFEVQTAICYGESGRPEDAAAIYEATLKPTVFSTRDYAYFSTLRAQTLVAAVLPDDAASVGALIAPDAVAAGSARTIRELVRLGAALGPWRHRPGVNAFLRLVATL
ncbi:hypothetical protein [Paractinoplanes hotanensis]|uniref:XRE family transcriptional regulator n=1 Tax=Paractinoplanes hotanensis TaxID=2906497 RepID=A0ABT0YA99_9ACTN|nr:hypothetical protein [Actinoplanes hotanensis]MCM4082234.1 hypothetical protein [Actinoplanes hotanensis]